MSTASSIISLTSIVLLTVAYWLNVTTISKLRQQLRDEQRLAQLYASAADQYRQVISAQNQTIEMYVQTLSKKWGNLE